MENKNGNTALIISVVTSLIVVFGSGVYIGYYYQKEPIAYKSWFEKIGSPLTASPDTVTKREVPQKVLEEIKGFRPYVQEIVKSYYEDYDQIYCTQFAFKGNGFTFWVANSYYGFQLDYPKRDVFEGHEAEKKYLYSLYESWNPVIR